MDFLRRAEEFLNAADATAAEVATKVTVKPTPPKIRTPIPIIRTPTRRDGADLEMEVPQESRHEVSSLSNTQSLDDTLNALRAKDETVSRLTESRAKLMQDLRTAEVHHREAVAAVTAELQQKTRDNQEATARYQTREAQLQAEIQQTTLALSAASRKVQEKETHISQLQHQVAKVQKELADYKSRAAAALQTRVSDNAASTPKPEFDTGMYDSLRRDHEDLLHQIEDLKLERDDALRSVDDWRMRASAATDASRAELHTLQRQIMLEQGETRAARTEVDLLVRKMAAAKDANDASLSSLMQQLSDRDAEISRLQNTLATRRDGNEAQRIRDLTEQLLAKTNTIESLAGERRGLQLQLEALRTAASGGDTSREHHHHVRIEEVPLYQPPSEGGFGDLTQGSAVQKAVGKVAVVADQLSLRAGQFLRRYPVLRVGVVFYAILLHIWVMYVLLGSTPSLPPSS